LIIFQKKTIVNEELYYVIINLHFSAVICSKTILYTITIQYLMHLLFIYYKI